MSGKKVLESAFGKSGSEKALKKFRPVDFSGGGLSGTFTPKLNKKGKPKRKLGFDFNLGRSSELQGTLDSIQARLGERALEFRGLRDRVAPGFGELTRTRVDAIRRAGERTVGNLRERFRQRRVLGSSFAEREIAGVESQFAAQEEQVAAEAKIQELGLTAGFLQEEFASSLQGLETLLGQYNIESGLALSAATAGQSAILASLQAAAQISEMRRDRNTNIFGTIVGAVTGKPT